MTNAGGVGVLGWDEGEEGRSRVLWRGRGCGKWEVGRWGEAVCGITRVQRSGQAMAQVQAQGL